MSFPNFREQQRLLRYLITCTQEQNQESIREMIPLKEQLDQLQGPHSNLPRRSDSELRGTIQQLDSHLKEIQRTIDERDRDTLNWEEAVRALEEEHMREQAVQDPNNGRVDPDQMALPNGPSPEVRSIHIHLPPFADPNPPPPMPPTLMTRVRRGAASLVKNVLVGTAGAMVLRMVQVKLSEPGVIYL